MHILNENEEPRPCVDCAKAGRIRLVRRLYGANNEALCLWCHAERMQARAVTAAITRHDGQEKAIDTWKPGDVV